MTMGVAASEVSRAMIDGGSYSPHTVAQALCSFRLLYWLQRWLVRGDGDGGAAHHSPFPCRIRGMGAPCGRQPTCFFIGVLLG